ncbi:MAG: hypothetical protein L3J06_08310, partial [Cyclobacteriaceae bacterium]|nr:hypothetical protein [Cyclobacteriaceae bacterium]
FMPKDATLTNFSGSIRQLIEVKIWENKYISYLLRKLSLNYLQFPDSKHSFHNQWKSTIKKLQNKPDIIYSRAYPLSSAIMACKLKRHFNIPWILHLSDPWAESPLHSYSTKELENHNRWEKKCFDAASYVTFTSTGTIQLYINKYPNWASKFKLFPNVYEAATQTQKAAMEFTKLRFVYTGGLAGDRSPEPILKAIKLIKDSNAGLLSNCEFIFAGDIDKKNKRVFDAYQINPVKHIGSVSYQKSMQLQQSAHVLLVIDSPISDASKSIFFPSKLLDYLATGNRMLAITTPNSTTQKFIQTHILGNSIMPTNIEEIKAHLLECIKQFKDRNTAYFKINKLVKEYEAQFNAERLIHLFDEIS